MSMFVCIKQHRRNNSCPVEKKTKTKAKLRKDVVYNKMRLGIFFIQDATEP